MSKKIIIFITVFILTGILILGIYFWLTKDKSSGTEGETSWYQNFNPFGTGSNIKNQDIDTGINIPDIFSGIVDETTSKFYQITDFAVAGATFLEDSRPIKETEKTPEPEIIKTIISTETKEGKIEAQKFLNESLSLNPPLVTDGIFGKVVTQAIKDFQKLKNLTVTGKIDSETAPFFTKTETINRPQNPYEVAPSIRYVERKNGHMYKMFLDTKTKEKISNSTIPGIYEAFFDKTAKTIVYRYLSSENIISSFMATLSTPKGEFLPQSISDFSTSGDKTKFFYLTKNSSGSTGMIRTFGETKVETVFNSPFTEWSSQWANEKIFLTTKPSYIVQGRVFELNTTNKTISKIFGGVQGLTTLISPDGNTILYGTSTNRGPKLGVFNPNNQTSKDLGTYGLPEKCVWGDNNIDIYCAVPNTITGNQFPDSWYQGLVSFDDYFVKINTQTGNKNSIANSIDETPIDGTHLFLSNKEDLLFFINKKDSTLWSLNLN